MKLTKSDLKQIVKECLVEILSEGIGTLPQQSKTLAAVPAQSMNVESFARNTQQRNLQKKTNFTPDLKDAIRKESGGNKIMESILADTALSTLPKMLQNDRPGAPLSHPGGIAEQVVASADPSDLFGGEAASRWANLAFMDSPIKK